MCLGSLRISITTKGVALFRMEDGTKVCTLRPAIEYYEDVSMLLVSSADAIIPFYMDITDDYRKDNLSNFEVAMNVVENLPKASGETLIPIALLPKPLVMVSKNERYIISSGSVKICEITPSLTDGEIDHEDLRIKGNVEYFMTEISDLTNAVCSRSRVIGCVELLLDLIVESRRARILGAESQPSPANFNVNVH